MPLFPNLLFLLGFCLHLARFLMVILDSCLSSQASFLTDHLIPIIFISHFSDLPLPPPRPAVLILNHLDRVLSSTLFKFMSLMQTKWSFLKGQCDAACPGIKLFDGSSFLRKMSSRSTAWHAWLSSLALSHLWFSFPGLSFLNTYAAALPE